MLPGGCLHEVPPLGVPALNPSNAQPPRSPSHPFTLHTPHPTAARKRPASGLQMACKRPASRVVPLHPASPALHTPCAHPCSIRRSQPVRDRLLVQLQRVLAHNRGAVNGTLAGQLADARWQGARLASGPAVAPAGPSRLPHARMPAVACYCSTPPSYRCTAMQATTNVARAVNLMVLIHMIPA